jgi:hypothetical protein
MNNNALTALTGGLTRPHAPHIPQPKRSTAGSQSSQSAQSIQSINANRGQALPNGQAVATPAPSVKVSLSDDVTGEYSRGQRITEKFEETTRALFASPMVDVNQGVDGQKPEHENTVPDGTENHVFNLAPLSLPTKADVESFEKLFAQELAKAGVDTNLPIKLSNDGEGGVVVTNDHPDKDKIEALFNDNPDLQQGFVKTEIYTTLQKIYELHQQWMEKIEGGKDEEAAGQWLVNASKNAVANSEITFNNGKVQVSKIY